MRDYMTQQEYIENWHESFVNHVNFLLGVVEGFTKLPNVTEEDIRGLNSIKVILTGHDVQYVERSLSESVCSNIVKRDTIEKIGKLNKDIVDETIKHITENPLWKEFLKQVTHSRIEKDMESEYLRLNALNIPIVDE